MTKVLIVEDEAHLAEGLRFNLQAEGYAVEVTGDGESALKRLLVLEFGPMGSRVGLPIQIHDGGNVVESCGTDLHGFFWLRCDS